MIGTLNWAKDEIEHVRLCYEHYLKEAEVQQTTILQVAGRENLRTLERRLQEPLRIVGSMPLPNGFDDYCDANSLSEAISEALHPNS